MNHDGLKNLLMIIFLLGFIVMGCQSKNSSVPSTGSSSPIVAPSETPDLMPKSNSTAVAPQSPTPSCVEVVISSSLTDNQMEYLQSHPSNFLYASNEKSTHNIYSVNRADIVCGPGYYASSPTTQNMWRVVSGFIVDVEQPQESLYHRGGEVTEGAWFVNIYAKARFLSQDGGEHDYWLQLTGNPPGYWFHLVQWDRMISESENESGLTVGKILMREKNGDGTSSYIDASTMIPNRLLRVNDQFIAMIYIGTTDGDSGLIAYSQNLQQFIHAIEGKAEFPIAPEGFFLRVQAMIVPSTP